MTVVLNGPFKEMVLKKVKCLWPWIIH